MATTNKYDRQLRLWGAAGQRALSECHVVLVNASAAGTETLKNLVLPGVGSFRVVDDHVVESSSDGAFSNFFAVPPSDDDDEKTSSSSRAEIACCLLSELNPDAAGEWRHVEDLETCDLGTDVVDDGTSLVVAADASLRLLRPLAKLCWERRVPLVCARSYGLIGTVRVQTPRHEIVESRPDAAVPDMRLSSPLSTFPELRTLVDEQPSPADLTDAEHAHLPWPVILCRALEEWRSQSGRDRADETARPTTFAEKKGFKEVVRSMSRDYASELNFQEAYKEAYLAYAKLDLPYETVELLNRVKSSSSSLDPSSSFDLMLDALRRFLEKHDDEPPLRGTIPDMTSTTDAYVALQNAYRARADRDLREMRDHLDDAIRERGSSVVVSDDDLAVFCRNVLHLSLLRTRSLEKELSTTTTTMTTDSGDVDPEDEEVRDDFRALLLEASSVEDAPLLWWLGVRACERFEERHGVWPGADDRELSRSADVDEVRRSLEEAVAGAGLAGVGPLSASATATNAVATEMVRYHAAEVHNVASVVGGVASQEAVKLVTKQYVPADNTFCFNGITGTAASFRA